MFFMKYKIQIKNVIADVIVDSIVQNFKKIIGLQLNQTDI